MNDPSFSMALTVKILQTKSLNHCFTLGLIHVVIHVVCLFLVNVLSIRAGLVCVSFLFGLGGKEGERICK